jgi:DNA replication and repair protein RecF
MPALAAEERFRADLAERRRIDAEAGTTTTGPHRSDLLVRHGGNGRPAAQCSTGEQKALLIAILLAHARLQGEARGAPPLLLLDEVAAHLDAARRRALFEEILALGAQAWMTGTDEALFAELRGRAQFFHVAEARIAPSIPPTGPRLAGGTDFIAEEP